MKDLVLRLIGDGGLLAGMPYELVSALVMLVFGAAGYALKKWDCDAVPLVLAFVLGRMMEETFRQSLLLSRGGLLIFLERPIAAGALAVAAAAVLLPLLMHRRPRAFRS